MNKKILITIVILIFVTLACGLPVSAPNIKSDVISEMPPVITSSEINYDEMECPVDTPTGYTKSICYKISDYSYGAIFYKDSAIKAFGLIIDVNYSDSALDDTVDFTESVVNEAGWDKDDILTATQKLSDTPIGETVTSGNIKASMDISGDQYLLIMYSHR